jgi:Arc/MetJ-type ribon-helix-helix transcriptional regulator
MGFCIARIAIFLYNTNRYPKMSSRRLQKVTYSLPEDLIERVRSVVKAGAAPSYSAFVEQALVDRVRRAHEQQLAGAFRSAAADPSFLADIQNSMAGFGDGGPSPDREGP